MHDLISRQAAIDALHMHLMYRMGTDSNKKRLDDWINGLPSAQETHEERTETHACDLISRQAAIDAKQEFRNPNVVRNTEARTAYDRTYANGWNDCNSAWINAIKALPSAQPESDNDTEFWRNRAKEYEKMVGELIADMSRGVKFESVELNENGLVFKKRAEQEWIPCRKGLPKEYGNYIVSIDGEEPDIGTINPNDKRGWGLCDANGFYWASDKMLNITAWMPLPESYKEGTDYR